MARLEADRANHAFLPGVDFPESLIIESDLEKAVQASRDLLVVVPSHVFGIVLNSCKPFLAGRVSVGQPKVLNLKLADCSKTSHTTSSVRTTRWPFYLAQRSRKSSRWVYQLRFPLPLQMQSSWRICKRKSTVAKPSACREQRLHRHATWRCSEKRYRNWRWYVRRHRFWCKRTYCVDYPRLG